ncbi:hypothetical protein BY996DRAFT_6478433 [Phakopsora pachyrhizi]|nr:hypothetical protein BY996DRAFT_6478433 [Phakopsora pachyrhizi]
MPIVGVVVLVVGSRIGKEHFVESKGGQGWHGTGVDNDWILMRQTIMELMAVRDGYGAYC